MRGTSAQDQHDRGVPNRALWKFKARKQHRFRIQLDGGSLMLHCIDPCDDPVIADLPDEDVVVVCECARPIEEPLYELALDITATLRFESLHAGQHEGPYCDCGWQFVVENVETA